MGFLIVFSFYPIDFLFVIDYVTALCPSSGLRTKAFWSHLNRPRIPRICNCGSAEEYPMEGYNVLLFAPCQGRLMIMGQAPQVSLTLRAAESLAKRGKPRCDCSIRCCGRLDAKEGPGNVLPTYPASSRHWARQQCEAPCPRFCIATGYNLFYRLLHGNAFEPENQLQKLGIIPV